MRPEFAFRAAALAYALLPVVAAQAEEATGGLIGRTVLFTIETFENPEQMQFVSREYLAQVGPGPEFGTVREGYPGIDAVPVLIDFSADRLDISFAETDPGMFAEARFNGYVLRFPVDCVLIEGASLDLGATTLPMEKKDVTFGPDEIRVNVSGHVYDRTSHIGVRLDVGDCLSG